MAGLKLDTTRGGGASLNLSLAAAVCIEWWGYLCAHMLRVEGHILGSATVEASQSARKAQHPCINPGSFTTQHVTLSS